MSQTFHMKVDLRGILLRAVNVQALDQTFKISGGRNLTGEETLAVIIDNLLKGRACLPLTHTMGECPDFDYSGGGCPGHSVAPKLRLVQSEGA